MLSRIKNHRNNLGDEVMTMLQKFDSNSKHAILFLQVIFDHFLKIVSCDLCGFDIKHLTLWTFAHVIGQVNRLTDCCINFAGIYSVTSGTRFQCWMFSPH